MTVRASQPVTLTFTLRQFGSGQQSNADSLPTGILIVMGANSGQAVTVAPFGITGVYTAAFTTPPTLNIGDQCQLLLSATVQGVTDNDVDWTDSKDILLDINGDVTANNVSGVTLLSAIDASGNIVLRQGADYLNVDGQALQFPSTGPVLTGALAVSLNLWTPSATGPIDAYTFPGSVVNSQQVMVELTRVQTATIALNTYNVEVFVQLADGDKLQIFRGTCLVRLP